MANSAPLSGPGRVDSIWDDIERQIEELARLARTDSTEGVFYPALVKQLALTAGCSFGGVWRIQHSISGQLSTRQLVLGHDTAASARSLPHGWLARMVEATEPLCLVPPTASYVPPREAGETHVEHTPDRVMMLGPVRSSGKLAAVLVFHPPANQTPREAQSRQAILAAFCEVASEFEDRQPVRLAKADTEHWHRVIPFTRAVHRQLDLSATCFAIANEGRRLFACDRVSVVARGRSKLRLQAISGIDLFDRRSGEVVYLERLAKAVAKTCEPLWYTGDTDSIPPQLSAILSEYVDHSTSRSVAVIPLLESEAEAGEPQDQKATTCPGVLVIERFDGEMFGDTTRRLLAAVSGHCHDAIRNAQRYSRVPWLARVAGSAVADMLARRKILLVLVAALVGGAAAALMYFQVDLQVSCRGQLQPSVQRDLFAPEPGLVAQLLVSTGSVVEEGDNLLVLTSAELDYEASQLTGELQTRQTELRSVQAQIATVTDTGAARRERMIMLHSQETRLHAVIGNLSEQLQLIDQRRGKLIVTSPIAGRVMTEDVRRRLATRPVRLGQRLLTVAAVDKDWQLDLKISDRDVAHVLQAQQSCDGGALVSYLLTTNPAEPFQAALSEVGLLTLVGDDSDPFVRGTVRIDRLRHGELSPGATVVARINCGPHRLGYVWFRGLWDILRTKFFLS